MSTDIVIKQSKVPGPKAYDLDQEIESHEDFMEVVSSFLEQRDSHIFDSEAQSFTFRNSNNSDWIFRA
ncbi:hypothetical protein V1520DRAFT_358611 [Lipomyces starkeyi]